MLWKENGLKYQHQVRKNIVHSRPLACIDFEDKRWSLELGWTRAGVGLHVDTTALVFSFDDVHSAVELVL